MMLKKGGGEVLGHVYILTNRVYFVNNWTVDVSSNSCNIDIGLREKNKEQTQKITLEKKVHKNVDERRS
jgi:hypothetical protein